MMKSTLLISAIAAGVLLAGCERKPTTDVNPPPAAQTPAVPATPTPPAAAPSGAAPSGTGAAGESTTTTTTTPSEPKK